MEIKTKKLTAKEFSSLKEKFGQHGIDGLYPLFRKPLCEKQNGNAIIDVTTDDIKPSIEQAFSACHAHICGEGLNRVNDIATYLGSENFGSFISESKTILLEIYSYTDELQMGDISTVTDSILSGAQSGATIIWWCHEAADMKEKLELNIIGLKENPKREDRTRDSDEKAVKNSNGAN